MELATSLTLKKYFQEIEQKVKLSYNFAEEARSKGLDPEKKVAIPIAKNMAERVVGLISVISPQVIDVNIPQRILDLENEYGSLDWRVGFKIAEEVAKEKFCKFETKLEAMEVGIRVGFAYLTLGIVSAPLEGFIGLKIKKRNDGKEYFALQYAGPIRAAGGTAASVSVILSDYVRVKMGYAPYDPSEIEINRYITEVHDYHDRVSNLQYHPSDEELKFMISHLPVEVDGDPTERFEVSNYKDLPRIETNLIRGGIALVLAEGLAQKAPKLWKRLAKWGKDFDLNWEWLNDFIKLKEKIHAQHTAIKEKKENQICSESEKKSVKANNTFIMDLVAGRPILTHPLGIGGFRLRYGRGRTTGFSSSALHPATLVVLNKFIAIGTQLKTERPGKATTVTICDSLEGPIVRLLDGSVVQLNSEEEAKKCLSLIEEIVFLGDILFSYGDFSENGQMLVPPGYCSEWWALELEQAVKEKNNSFNFNFDLQEFIIHHFSKSPTWDEALEISMQLNIPMHPAYTFYWKLVSFEELLSLISFLKEGRIKKESVEILKIILPFSKNNPIYVQGKKVLDYLGVSHKIINKENLILEKKEAEIFAYVFNFKNQEDLEKIGLDNFSGKNGLEIVNILSSVKFRDKAGTFIGARMGRPEKAKMRLMTGSPQVMFPVGDEGDRLRSFQAALKNGKVRSAFPLFYCTKCQREMIYAQCEECGGDCEKRHHCVYCGDTEKSKCRHGDCHQYKTQDLDIKYYFEKAKERINEKLHPDLIKGVRGTANKNHLPEHLAKGILRAKHDLYVNKDGTIRYDCTELPLTHFKPKEIHASVKKLKELGYNIDIYGQELIDDHQILEIKPQDIILPGFDSLDESAPKVLMRVANFIDELLIKFYQLKSFYNIKKMEDLCGHLVIGLAPHISAGLIGRIIGFSETQGLITHPMFHAGMRRDCFAYDTRILLSDGVSWNEVEIGNFVDSLNLITVVDDFGTKVKKVKGMNTIGFNPLSKKIEIVPIKEFTKHVSSEVLEIITEQGRKIKVTKSHKFLVGEKHILKKTQELAAGDKLILPYNINIPENNFSKINLLEYLQDEPNVCVRGVSKKLKILVKKQGSIIKFSKNIGISPKLIYNYLLRDSIPSPVLKKIVQLAQFDLINFTKGAFLGTARDHIKIPIEITLNKEVLELIGLYIAEGYSRKKIVGKGFFQVYIAAEDEEIRLFIKKTVKDNFGLSPTENKKDRITFSSRIFYNFFVDILQAGSSAYEKRIPSLFLNLEKKKLGHLLRGYYEGDGSVSKGCLRVSCDTVSKHLIENLKFVFSRYGVFVKCYEYTKEPGPMVKEFYIKKGKGIPQFTITKITISSEFMDIFNRYCGFLSTRKKNILKSVITEIFPQGMRIEKDEQFVYDSIKSIKKVGKETTYCLNVKHHNVMANGILTKQCDGDEACVMLLMDALLNFSRQYLPEKRGAKTMDAPLVLTSILNPAEVDDQVHGLDVVWKYPLEFYEAALEMKMPWEVKHGAEKKKIEQLSDRLGTSLQYEQFGFTHHVDNFNKGVQCSAYKTLPSMLEKLDGQMDLAKKIRAVNMDEVAKLVIQKHFLKDIKGNFKKFSMQQFRCVKCNTQFSRPPLNSKCTCGGKLIFTISEGSVVKYLGHSLELARKYDFSPYLKQTLDILKKNIDQVFGKEKEKQAGLGDFLR